MESQRAGAGVVEEVVVTILRAGRGLSLKTLAMTGAYLAVAGALVGAVAYAGLRGQPALIDGLNHYIFPSSWHGFSSRLVAMILERVPPDVWVNGVVLLGLQIAALTLFPLKERISLAVEREQGLSEDSPDEFPLVRQGVEELKLLVINLALGGAILWLGYSTAEWRRDVASILSHLHLAGFFAVDFMAPMAQRHRASVEQILSALARKPVAPMLFGLILTAPSSLMTRSDGQAASMLLLVFLANAVPMAWATLAGTRLMASDLRRVQSVVPVSRRGVLAAWLLAGGWVMTQGAVLGAVASSVHAKSQVLKCDYSLPMDGFRVDQPSWMALLSGRLELTGYVTLAVDNPTEFDLAMEKNRLVIAVDGAPWWEGSIPTLRASARSETRVKVPFEVTVTAAQALEGAKQGWSKAKALWSRVSEVFKRMDSPASVVDQAERTIAATQLRFEAARQRVSVTLYLEIFSGFEFPIYLLAPP